MTSDTGNPPKPVPQATSSGHRTPTIDIRDLIDGGREAIIVHAGEAYRLRVTANNKLILTK